MNKTLLMLITLVLSNPLYAGGSDDPLVTKVMIDKLEMRVTDGPDPWLLDADAWVGYDLNKFWFKTEMEVVDGDTEEAELQFLYSRAVAPFWDFQAGWRRDLKPESRDYLALGFKGLAPYLFEVDTGLFVGQSGQVGARVDAEYEYLFTQKLVLSPEMEINVWGRNDQDMGIGSGLSDMSLGLRLRYEIRREFAPYIGVNWTKLFGKTADYAEDEGEDSSDLQWVMGIRAWF